MTAIKSFFFIFLFYNTLTGKFDGNTLAKKAAIFFSNEKFLLIEQLSISTHSTKLLILLLLNMLLEYFINFI